MKTDKREYQEKVLHWDLVGGMVYGEDRKGPSLCRGWCSENQRDIGETGSAVCFSEVTGVIKMGSNGKTDWVNVIKREP